MWKKCTDRLLIYKSVHLLKHKNCAFQNCFLYFLIYNHLVSVLLAFGSSVQKRKPEKKSSALLDLQGWSSNLKSKLTNASFNATAALFITFILPGKFTLSLSCIEAENSNCDTFFALGSPNYCRYYFYEALKDVSLKDIGNLALFRIYSIYLFGYLLVVHVLWEKNMEKSVN